MSLLPDAPTFAMLAAQYRDALLNDVIPFWMQHSIDEDDGGYFTCLDRQGRVFDTDKFVWLQGRQIWTFSMLCNHWPEIASPDIASSVTSAELLDVAAHGAKFLREKGRDGEGNWYFSLDRHGRPLVQPYNVFSDCFAAMGFSQYALASGDKGAREIAQKTFENILRRRDNPKGRYNKAVPGARPMKPISIPMILSNVVLEMEWQLAPETTEVALSACVEEIMRDFFDENRNLFFERVAPDGSHPDTFDGRLISPGHSMEVCWFLLDAAKRVGADQLPELISPILYSILNTGWDHEHGGLYYYLDIMGKPPQQLEWDQKLWWVHAEALVALIKAYSLTRDKDIWRWFVRLHDYTWSHFPDPEYGEWFGYLNRRGEVLLNLKGGKWKGCFHVPRALFLCWRELQNLLLTPEH